MSLVFLVGVDCSNCGGRALEYATDRASVKGAKVLVAHVIEWSPFSFSTPQENEERHKRREEEIRRAQTEIIEPIVANLRERGIQAEGIVRHGHAAETLARIAKENKVTNIVVGRRGSSRFKAQVFGSVASSLVQIADRPVTVVP
ncbi:MAG: universal stress protein [Xanthomonadales bacterium]|nr:universal stress protein [Xanthomonadales bacterium]NNL94686.1 universal stress protein [Xanthomonadales bacterium]